MKSRQRVLTIHSEVAFAREILDLCRRERIHTAIESSLAWPWERMAPVLEWVDVMSRPALSYDDRLRHLREKKLEQTRRKADAGWLVDIDDAGAVLPPPDFDWHPTPTHPNGCFYGSAGWGDNFRSLLEAHPTYVDPMDALAGRWMVALFDRYTEWNPAYDYGHLRILGMQNLIGRTVDAIRAAESLESRPELKANLQEMGEVNEWLVENPPRTLREACQWISWFSMMSRAYNSDGAGSRLDELLRPCYERDMAAGRIDDDTAIFTFACLLLADTHYYQLGGTVTATAREAPGVIDGPSASAGCLLDGSRRTRRGAGGS